MRFVDAEACQPSGYEVEAGYINYFLGNDPSRWRSRVNSYAVVRYEELYPYIDMEIMGAEKALKYNIVVRPKGDPAAVKIVYEGTDGVEVTSQGDLRVRTAVRDVVELQPYVYQIDAQGNEVEVLSRWRVRKLKNGDYQATIEVGNYDKGIDLVIDPMLVFSTYTGSTADNWGATATYDSKKNGYTAGLVFDVGYPTSVGAYQSSYGGGSVDVGIFKFDKNGTSRLYATYLGGSSSDMPHSLFVNSFDELLVFGTTGSNDFPTTVDAYQTTFAGGTSINYLSSAISYAQGSDMFVCRLSEDGTQLEASTYVGGSGNDGLNYRNYYNNNTATVMSGNDTLYYNYGDGARGELITDNLNNIYVGSTTFSTDFPTTTGCVQPTCGGKQDAVVFKLDHNLKNLLWSTYLGGTGDDAVYSIDVDSVYNLLVCGGTSSSDFPVTAGVAQEEYGGGTADGFVSKISYDGSSLMASTFLGERFYDQLYFVRVGRHDEVFLFGQTYPCGGAMIKNASYSVFNSGMLLARLSNSLDEVEWSTVFGTNGRINLSPTAFAVDICDRVYAVGWGRDFVGYGGIGWNTAGTTGMEVTTDAYSSTTDGQDFYIISLDDEASSLMYATFFGEKHGNGVTRGSDHVDGGTSRFDRLSNLYQSVCASCSGNQGFPITTDAWSSQNKSNNCNNALFRFRVADDYPVAEFTMPTAGCAPYTVQFSNSGRANNFLWDFGDGSTSTDDNPSHTYSEPGNYTVTLVAYLNNGCKTTDTMRHTVQVLGNVSYSHPYEALCNGTPIQIGATPTVGATYVWSGDPVSDPTIANPWVSSTGTYILTTTAEGCSQVDTFLVGSYTLVDLLMPTAVHCHDSANGGVLIRFGNGLMADSLVVEVSPACVVGEVFEENGRLYAQIDSLRGEVNYHITVSGYGCLYQNDVRLENPPKPAYQKDAVAALCTDSCQGSIHIRYNLSAIPEESPCDTVLQELCPGVYVVELTSLGCPLVDTTVIFRDHSVDGLVASADRNEIILGETIRLFAHSSTDSTGQLSYAWQPAADLDNPNVPSPHATPSQTEVCYTVTATSSNGCSARDSVCIHCTEIVCGAPDFVIPNAFTPNGDGLNDRVCFNADVLAEFSIAIFNRWGQCVYQSTDATQCWDGMYMNAPCLAGVYTYTCTVKCLNGVQTDFKGDITLIR